MTEWQRKVEAWTDLIEAAVGTEGFRKVVEEVLGEVSEASFTDGQNNMLEAGYTN